MDKDRDQLTPDEPSDVEQIHPRRSAARTAEGPVDRSTGRGPASHGADPPATSEVGEPDKDNYK